METQTLNQPTQVTENSVVQKKNPNMPILIAAGVATGISSFLSDLISNVIYSALSYLINTGSFSAIQIASYLGPNVGFIVRVIILLIGAAIVCKGSASLIKFLACCISGNVIGSFVGNVIYLLINTVIYVKDINLSVLEHNNFSIFTRSLGELLSVLFAVVLLLIVTKEKETTASTSSDISSAQAAQPLNSEVNAQPVKSTKSRGAAIALCIFFGTLGIHRFYTGKVGTAILWMLTGGLLGIGAIIDFFMILFGSFKDSDGLTLS